MSFDAFISDLSRSRYTSVAASGRAGEVRSTQAFAEMRSYALSTYRGVKVDHSYQADGSYFDCVTVESQPGVRALGGKPIAAPPTVDSAGKAAVGRLHAASPLTLGLKDSHGHAISCRAGTIPMQRISLDRLTKSPPCGTSWPSGRAAAPSWRQPRASTHTAPRRSRTAVETRS